MKSQKEDQKNNNREIKGTLELPLLNMIIGIHRKDSWNYALLELDKALILGQNGKQQT